MRRYLALGAVALAVLPGAAHAQTKLEARYAVTLAGIPLGAGTWVIDIAADQYTAVASGRTTGLVKLVSDGSGTTGSKGTLQGANVISSGYIASMISDTRADEVRMTMGGGGMMNGSHGGMGWGMMGANWRHTNGSYGMVFTFTTG